MTLPPPSFAPPPPPAAAKPALAGVYVTGAIACAGALLLIVGSTMSWVTLTTGFGSATVSGTSGDGKITAAAGVIALILLGVGTGTTTAGMLRAGAGVGGLGAALSVWKWFDLQASIDEMSTEFGRVDVGTGLYLCILGGIVALVLGLVAASQPTA